MNGANLDAFAVLSELGDDERQTLLESLIPRRFEQGRRLFNEGTEAEEMILLTEGRVRLESKERGASESLEAPIHLGGLCLVRVGSRLCTVRAETPCSVLLLGRTAYRRLVEDQPRIACRLLEGLLAESAEIAHGLTALLADPRAPN